MTLWQAALLGLVQGLTEFLPVSSSGHLALAQMLIPGFEQPGVVFDTMLHVGTACAVVWYERRNIVGWLRSTGGRRLLALLLLGTLATVVVAFPLRRIAEAAFAMPAWVAVGLLTTAVVVGSTRLIPGGSVTESTMTWRRVVAVGLAQGVAIFPGLSRSGVTIAASFGAGLERTWAARFSFLISVPVVAAVAVGQVFERRIDVVAAGNGFVLVSAVGAVVAGVTGYLALRLVIAAVSSRVFHRFAWYCLPLGLLVLALVWGGR